MYLLGVNEIYGLDPAKVKLLLHFDSNFNDSSQNNVMITTSGSVSIDNSIEKFGGGALLYGQSPRNGYLKTAPFFNFGNKRPFTLRLNYNGTGITSSTGAIVTTRDSGVITQFEIGRGGTLLFGDDSLSSWSFVGFNLLEDENWKDLAIVGDGTNIKIYRDGNIAATTTHPNWPSENSFLQFGKNGDGAFSDNRIDEVLLYDGVLWTGNFTPPTQAYY